MSDTTAARPTDAPAPSVKHRRARRALALVLVILILLLGLAGYLLYSAVRADDVRHQ